MNTPIEILEITVKDEIQPFIDPLFFTITAKFNNKIENSLIYSYILIIFRDKLKNNIYRKHSKLAV